MVCSLDPVHVPPSPPPHISRRNSTAVLTSARPAFLCFTRNAHPRFNRNPPPCHVSSPSPRTTLPRVRPTAFVILAAVSTRNHSPPPDRGSSTVFDARGMRPVSPPALSIFFFFPRRFSQRFNFDRESVGSPRFSETPPFETLPRRLNADGLLPAVFVEM